MADDSDSAAKPTEDARRRRLLDAALTAFFRHGFRKTSMDEVARAAQVSRQALYLHFSTKEELFRATVLHLLEGSQRAATEALSDGSQPLEARLVRAFDECVGRFVGQLGAGAADLAEVSSSLVGPLIADSEEQLVDAVARALRASGLMAAYKRSGLTARQLADTLHATARGLKYSSPSREAFVQRMTLAARAMCAPLGEDA